MKKLLRCLTLLIALFPLGSLTSTVHAASHLSNIPAQPNWAASWNEPTTSFWDSNLYGFLPIDGSLSLNAAYVSNPPTIVDQHMYAHITEGAFYGVYPGTYDTINDKNGGFIGSYNITGGSCITPGYPDASTCGDNYSSIRPSNWGNCPVTVYHQWTAVDSGYVVGAGNWSHATSLC